MSKDKRGVVSPGAVPGRLQNAKGAEWGACITMLMSAAGSSRIFSTTEASFVK